MCVSRKQEKMKIKIQQYDKNWKKYFEEIRDHLLNNIKGKIDRVEHIGSTSVPGMSAKPIIDIDIIVEDDELNMKLVIKELENLGYNHLGEMGISGREAFSRSNPKTPVSKHNKDWNKHNLYLCKKDSIGLRNHLALKKHLLEHPDKVIEYSRLKEELAVKYQTDIDSYVEGKTKFITNILKIEGITRSEIETIKRENKKPAHKKRR